MAAGAALVLGIATAPQASAAGNDACTIFGCYTGDPKGSGFARWVGDGDKMWVCDRSADGKSIVVGAVVESGGSYRALPDKWHTTGAGGCTERSYGNLAEGQEIWFVACLGDYSQNTIDSHTCGTERQGTT